MRRKLVAGNWKMNGDLASLAELDTIAAAAAVSRVDVAIAVPFTLIAAAAARVGGQDAKLAIGAQDVYPAACGAFTGSVSPGMIADVGATFSIVGHSERRGGCHERDADVKAKAEALRAQELSAILCVGETLEQRDAGHAEQVVTDQVAASLPAGASAQWLSIAYEPIWAIGTGRTPTTADVATMHGAIRARLRDLLGTEAEAVRLLYGGSVTGDNATELLGASDVDGALVGGASLTAAKFVPIIEAAVAVV